MDDCNPMRDREARDALHCRVMDGLASGIEKGAVRYAAVLALLDLADEGETAAASASAYHAEMLALRAVAGCLACAGTGRLEDDGVGSEGGDHCAVCAGTGTALGGATAWRLRWESASAACDEARRVAVRLRDAAQRVLAFGYGDGGPSEEQARSAALAVAADAVPWQLDEEEGEP